eukprot:TRINITY_DN67565_c0_g1_i1.p1 TRINITY_DN67565_c0_g1~~TRINITY_DN67565_c0_g1_i1.p1  ORF type:complete len:1153 (-),score=220.65 TRINITY_DN67565_c0_g1_i1:85-3543(-)
MPKASPASSFEVNLVMLNPRDGDRESKTWRRSQWGKVLKVQNAFSYSTSKLRRQHKTELVVRLSSGTWKRKTGPGMRIEISDWNFAALDEKRLNNSDTETSGSSFGSGDGMFGMFDSFRERRPRGPELCTVRALQFMFSHVQSSELSIADAVTDKSPVATAAPASTSSAASSSAANINAASQSAIRADSFASGVDNKPSSDGSAREEKSGRIAQVGAIVKVSLSQPLRCFQQPREAEDAFMRPVRNFAANATQFELGFASKEHATDFLAELRRGVEESERQMQLEKWSLRVAKFHDIAMSKLLREPKAEFPEHDLRSWFALRPLWLENLLAQVDALPRESFARKSIRRWNLVPPAAAALDSFDVPAVLGSVSRTGIEQPPDLAYITLEGLDDLWRRYFDLRGQDEAAFEQDRQRARHSRGTSWDTGDGHVPQPKRFGFTMKLRMHLARALVSTRAFSAVEAREVSKGLFVHHFYICEDGGHCPRTVELCVRLYSHVAEPSAVTFRYMNHCRHRFSFNEQFNFLRADISGLAALREEVRKGLNIKDPSDRDSAFLRQAFNARTCTATGLTLSLSTVNATRTSASTTCPDGLTLASTGKGDQKKGNNMYPALVMLLFPEERATNVNGGAQMVSRTIFRQDAEHKGYDQKEYVSPVEHLRKIVAVALGELHPVFQMQPGLLRCKLYTIISRACGLYVDPVRRMPHNNWVMDLSFSRHQKQGTTDLVPTDGEEVCGKLALPPPAALISRRAAVVIAPLPQSAQIIIAEFLRGDSIRLLRPGQLLGSVSETTDAIVAKIALGELSDLWQEAESVEAPASKRARLSGCDVDSDGDSKFYDSGMDDDSESCEEEGKVEKEEEEEEAKEEKEGESQEAGEDRRALENKHAARDRNVPLKAENVGGKESDTDLMIEYLEQEKEECWNSWEAAVDSDADSMDALIEYERSSHMLEVSKKIVFYTRLLKKTILKGSGREDECMKDLFEWKLAKYKAKIQSVEDGWMVDPSGSEGTSWCSTDFDEEEPTASELEEKRSKQAEDAERVAKDRQGTSVELDRNVADMRRQLDEARQRSPERMREAEEASARAQEEEKAELAQRKLSKRKALEEIRRTKPELWQKILDDRRLHREKRVRMGRGVGKKYGDAAETEWKEAEASVNTAT